jgi:hypothetical protein
MMFALPHDGCLNGWNLTGGNFIKESNTHILNGDFWVNSYSIGSYSGGNTMYLNTTVEGILPDLNSQSNIEPANFNEDFVQNNETSITGESLGRMTYVDGKTYFYNKFINFYYDRDKQLPFPQTRVVSILRMEYNPDTKTLHSKTESHLYPSEQKPDKPTINGPTNGKPGAIYEYTFGMPLDELGYLYTSWGDAIQQEWLGPYQPGEEVVLSNTWTEQGEYTIRAKVKKENNLESDWETLEVNIPRDKSLGFNFDFLVWLFERFPNALPILRQLLELNIV